MTENYKSMFAVKDNMKTVTIPKKEYLRLKRCKRTDDKLLKQLINRLEDVRPGKINPDIFRKAAFSRTFRETQ